MVRALDSPLEESALLLPLLLPISATGAGAAKTEEGVKETKRARRL